MQIVINIDENYYEIIKHDVQCGNDYLPFKLIAKGIPTRGSYEQGYNDAKREIVLSGEYERAYRRGFCDALNDCTNRLKALNAEIKKEVEDEN